MHQLVWESNNGEYDSLLVQLKYNGPIRIKKGINVKLKQRLEVFA